MSDEAKRPRRSLKDYALITLKGLGMGAADVVPGVSGGTIAFITGIYEELLDSIRSVDLKALKVLRKEGFSAFWQHINGTFLVAVFLGIAISVASLAKLLSYLWDNQRVLLLAFFIGLILASAVVVARKVKKWDFGKVLTLLIGGGLAFLITSLTKIETPETAWFVFLAGAIAISAMILPGISGSFILLILGKYEYIIDSIKKLDIGTILVFGAGCFVGLLSFVRLVSWAFKKFHDHTVAALTGFMVGSLVKVWPWKLCYRLDGGDAAVNDLFGCMDVTDKHELTRIGEINVTPAQYTASTGLESQVLYVVLIGLAAFGLVLALELIFGEKKEIEA